MNILQAIPRPRARRGFLVMDAVIGISMALLLLMALTSAVAMQAKAEKRMAAQRHVARAAEAALLALQNRASPDPQVRVDRLTDAAPPDWAWVRVTAPPSGDAPAQTLVGLVPASVLPDAARNGGQ